MAERAEALSVERRDASLAPVVPVRTEGELSVSESTSMAAIKERAAAGYSEARDRAARSYSELAAKSNALLSDLKRWGERVRNENPMQVVAVVAGAAFLLGIALRLWKSKRDA